MTESGNLLQMDFILFRSVYHNIMDSLLVNDNYKIDANWKKLWSLQTPPKVKHLLWRIPRQCLPSRQRLCTIGAHCPATCAFWETNLENDWHVFFGCEKAILVWQQAGLWSTISSNVHQAEGITYFLSNLRNSIASESLCSKISIILWSLWRQRNDKVSNNLEMLPNIADNQAFQFLSEWQQALSRNNNLIQLHDHEPAQVWQKPEPGKVKCNIGNCNFQRASEFCYWHLHETTTANSWQPKHRGSEAFQKQQEA